MANIEPKFKTGDLALHRLGFKCVIVKAYTEAKIKNEDGTEGETTQLEVPVYAIHFLAANGGVVESQVREDLLDEYVS